MIVLAGAMDWGQEFRAYTGQHWAALGVCALAIVATAAIGVRVRGSRLETPLRVGLGWTVLMYKVGETIYDALPHRFDVAGSLPLQFCDLVAFAAGGALVARSRVYRVLLYFWGVGLSPMAVMMPTLRVGWFHADYWLFWISHTLVLCAAGYDIVARGYRPTLRDFGSACAWSLVYLAVVMGVNAAFGVNYGFVGNPRSGSPAAIEQIGPWPFRVLPLAVCVGLLFHGLYAVWRLPMWLGLSGRRASG